MNRHPTPSAAPRRKALALAALLAAGLAVAGCDKCGHRVRFNAPEIQKACADDTPSAR